MPLTIGCSVCIATRLRAPLHLDGAQIYIPPIMWNGGLMYACAHRHAVLHLSINGILVLPYACPPCTYLSCRARPLHIHPSVVLTERTVKTFNSSDRHEAVIHWVVGVASSPHIPFRRISHKVLH